MKHSEYKWRGGGQVGFWYASWPFATLHVTNQFMTLKMKFIGEYKFTKDQIKNIHPYGIVPFFATGIKIQHNIKGPPQQLDQTGGYPETFIFWCIKLTSKSVIRKIREMGYGS